MKHLNEYILEKIEIDFEPVNESSEKWFRIPLNDFEGAVDSLKSILSEKDIYSENIDGGIKIKVKEGQAELLSSVIEFLTEIVTDKAEDEKLKDAVEKLSAVIVEITKFKDDASESAEKEAEEKADKTDEE